LKKKSKYNTVLSRLEENLSDKKNLSFQKKDANDLIGGALHRTGNR
jgi:hypothetical protein